MVSIDISDDQREYLEQLRVRLAAEHVGEYGHVRTRDALQYLIDQHESDDASAPMPNASTPASASEGTASAPALEPDAALDPDSDESNAAAAERAEAAENAGEPVEEADADTEDEARESSDESDDASESGSGPGRLQRMMTLLDDHEDKWDAVDSNQGKYVVELPDGEHEFARTKDDVRAVLFKHYR